MLPIRLVIRNFLAYRAPAPIDFAGIHLACLSGDNGAGKSSLLDAITWALWGKARAKRDEELIHMGQTEMSVLLEFEQAGTRYQVRRSRSKSKTGSVLVFYSVADDGSLVDLDAGSIRATQALIDATINLDYETFTHSAFLRQGNADAFTLRTARERKQLLADILGLSRFDEYEERVKEAMKGIAEAIAVDEAQIREIDAEISRESQLRRALGEAQTALIEAGERTRAAADRFEELRDAASNRRHAEDRQRDAEARLKTAESRLRAAAAQVEVKQKRANEYAALIAHRAEIEDGYHALQAARDLDQALGEKLIALKDVDDRRAALERAIAAARAALDGERRETSARVESLSAAVAKGDSPALDDLRAQIAGLRARDSERDPISRAREGRRDRLAGLRAENQALMADMNKLADRRKRLESVQEAVCPFCGQPLDADHRARLLEEIVAEGTPMGRQYRENGAEISALETLIREDDEALTAIALAVQPLPDLQARAGRLEQQLEAAHAAESALQTEAARLEALTAALDSDEYAHAEREELAALDAARAALDYDQHGHDDARRTLRTYNEYDVRWHQLHNALEAHDAAGVDLAAAQAEHAARQAEWESDRAIIATLQEQIAELTALASEAQRRFEELRQRQSEEQAARDEVTATRQALESIDRARERRVLLHSRIADAREQRGLYEELRTAFGKNGIPAMIIDAALPELEEAANRLLGQMSEGQMSIAITTQREKATGGVAETLDILIADNLGTRAYEMYSGGEAFRINFALRVALSQMLARRAGAQLRTLFIDEGFGTQDEHGRARLVEAITAIQEEFEMILVITHIDDLRDAFPVHIEIRKTEDGSQIALR